MRQRHLQMMVLAGLMALMALAGCASHQAVPRDPADVPGYLNAPPDLAGVDPAPLGGRRILIDPGHGGHFRGAVGDDGLAEAEVNLGVALYLQGLLQWAGAEVFMTRTADVDFLSPADSTLAGDLAARVALADSLLPDVFVSIHHNSTAQRDPDINETQTYYPLGREGADLDLARAIHRQLVLALEIEPAKILPGGFHVLRNSPVPAVLGEPAMISNPVIEGRLSLARSLELEASAYFLGLRAYFAGGMPRWISDLPDTVEVTVGSSPLSWTFDAGEPADPGLDPASVTVRVDGRTVPFDLSADGRTVSVAVVTGGAATVDVMGRNLAGRAAAAFHHVVRRPGTEGFRWALIAESDTTHAAYGEHGDSGLMLIYETAGHELSEYMPLSIELGDGSLGLPIFPGSRGWCLLDRQVLVERGPIRHVIGYVDSQGTPEGRRFAPLGDEENATPWVGRLEDGMAFLSLRCPQDIWPGHTVPGSGWRTRLPFPERIADLFTTSGPLQDPLLGRLTPVLPAHPERPLWLEADGAVPLFGPGLADAPPGGPTLSPRDTLTWRPILPALIGKRVALDARGGGSDDQGLGPLGARGSELNLQVAARLAALLRGAGCEVVLLREAEIFTPDPERVRRADAFGADLYLAIGRGEPGVRHHHGSTFGTPWAASCAAAITPLLADTVSITADSIYILRHTACPAILIDLEAPATAAIESRLTDPPWQDAMARALFRGTVTLLQPDAPFAQVPDLLAALADRAWSRERIDLVRLDGNFSWLPPSGQVTASPVPSWGADDPGLPVWGDHHVIEVRAGPHWQLWALERLPGGDWHGRVLLENR